ncbi:PQQ-binding-like beta-propeller repeat protein [Verrucomicrobiota bacterium]
MKKLLTICCLLFSALSLYAATSLDIIKASGVKGGLVVCIGAGTPELVAGLCANDSYLVHCLDVDQKNVDAARKYIHGKGLYGKVSVDTFDGKHLPYADNLVNLLIVHSPLSNVHGPEIMRVLTPRGVAMIRKNSQHPTSNTQHPSKEDGKSETSALDVGRWLLDVQCEDKGDYLVFKKPVPPEIDDWTHYLHGADGNAVANDTVVGAPRSLQWVGDPRWARSHEELASMSACVSSKGRLFYIIDEATPDSLRYIPQWRLVARDAFNGTILWKSDVGTWIDHLRHFRAGPVHLPRRLVAVGDEVYVTLGLGEPVVALDAATGKTLRVYENTEFTDEIICHDGVLYLVVGTSEAKRYGDGLSMRNEPDPTDFRYIVAIDVKSGKQLWKHDSTDGEFILPLSLAARGNKVLFQNAGGVVCLDSKSGKQIWKTKRETPSKRMSWSGPTMVVHDEVVLLADRGLEDTQVPAAKEVEFAVSCFNVSGIPRKGALSFIVAYSLDDGKELWSAPCSEGYNVPVDVFIAQNLVWIGGGIGAGRDLKTGEIKRTITTDGDPVGMVHPRCYRNKATEKMILGGYSGIEIIDLEKGWTGNNSWVRGTCQYGIMPANGLLYAPPNACGCFNKVKLQGFLAVSPQRTGTDPKSIMEKGLIYDQISNLKSQISNASAWPMYRQNSERGGAVAAKLKDDLKIAWSSGLGGNLTQPVSVGDKVFVASVDTHTVYALDVNNGKELWSYTAGGRVDSAPTIYKGLLLFGSRDGWVYCLRASDGKLAWRFRAAPEERLINSFGQLESAWPVHGAVLVQNDIVYFAAGRNSYIDGGLRLYGLNPITGEKVMETQLSHIDAVTGKQTGKEGKKGYAKFDMEGTLNDVLSGDGKSLFLKHYEFESTGKSIRWTKPHLFTPTGFLGEEWFVRNYWIYGTGTGAGYGAWSKMTGGAKIPAGRIMCFDDKTVYVYGRSKIEAKWTGHRGDAYSLFAMSRDLADHKVKVAAKADDSQKIKNADIISRLWTQNISLTVRSMVLSGDKLILAGLPDVGIKPEELIFENQSEAEAAYKGEKGSFLWVVSTLDGSRKSEYKLVAPPVFDGMSAADDKLFISLKNGEVVCFN